MKKVVVIGGGNGSAISIQALKHVDAELEISAIVSTLDSGGSSGRLRKEFQTLPTGDVMRAVLAMSSHDFCTLKKVFYKNRFEGNEKLEGHNLGNLFLVLTEKYNGDFVSALRALEQALDATGHVHPITLEQSDLVAEMSDGTVVKGEHEIDRPEDGDAKIVKAWVEPTVSINPDAKKVLEAADYIVFGPGSLYCSVIVNLLIPGVKEAIASSKAKLGFIIGNAYEQKGEHGPQTICESVEAIESYLPRKLDCIVYNNHELTSKEKKHYDDKDWALLVDDSSNCLDHMIVSGDYESAGGGLDAIKLANLFKECLS
jgi:uncharacterized cofD-like protein